MTDLLWPGDERAAELFDDASFLDAMVRVENAWLDTIVALGLAPVGARADLVDVVGGEDAERVAATSEAGGNPVLGLVGLLRDRLGPGETATWVHRGLTSQDVVDSATMLCLATTLDRVDRELAEQASAVAHLAREHRTTRMAARTLTQHAVPTTFGVKAAGWTGSAPPPNPSAGAAPRSRLRSGERRVRTPPSPSWPGCED
jgi:3-carboxy-cis,cis-muconate cycloisomerase